MKFIQILYITVVVAIRVYIIKEPSTTTRIYYQGVFQVTFGFDAILLVYHKFLIKEH